MSKMWLLNLSSSLENVNSMQHSFPCFAVEGASIASSIMQCNRELASKVNLNIQLG